MIDLAAVDPVTTSLLVVAHNPTVHELVASLAHEVPDVLVERGLSPRGSIRAGNFAMIEPIGLSRYPVVAQFIPDGVD